MFDLLRLMLGLHNTRKIELEESLDKGKGYLINAQTVLIDEAKSSGSWSEKSKLINTLKTIIEAVSDRRLLIIIVNNIMMISVNSFYTLTQLL